MAAMPGDAPTPGASSSIWNSNGLVDPASLWHSSLMAPPTMNGDPLNSRLFVVCGKSIEADTLSEAFARFGHIQSVRLVRDKGVAYVKYDKASSAAAAIEALHETSLCDGRGPMLKVMVAEAPTRRSGSVSRQPEAEIATDPDNIPPRSRLFMVVPKTADGSIIEAEMAKFRDLEYCKIDLIAAKGIAFVKYAKSSSALLALESILANDCMVCDYKVKVMIAEPKGKRGRRDPLFSEAFAHAMQQPGLDYGSLNPASYSAIGNRRFPSQGLSPTALHNLTDARAGSGSLSNSLAPGYPQTHPVLPLHEQHMDGVPGSYGMGSALHGHGQGLGSYNGLTSSNGLSLDRTGNWRQDDGSNGENFGMAMNIAQIQAMAADLGARTLGQAIANQGVTHSSSIGNKHPGPLLNGISEEGQDTSAYQSPMHMEHMASHSLTRLYIVVSKSVTEDTLEYMFGVFEGLEYVDLKRDHASGLSRGFAYVRFNNPISAASAVERYNGFELPAGSGLRLKVMYAENLQLRQGGKGTPPLASSRSLSARSDSTSSILQPRTGDMISPGVQSTNMGRAESAQDLREQRYAEVAAIQNSLAHMSMPHHGDLGAYGHSTPPLNRGQRSPLLSPSDQETTTWVHLRVGPEGNKDESADSGPVPLHAVAPDEHTLFTELSRPMPDYALEHVFAQHGPIEWVRLRPDERYGVVRFATADAVQSAIDALHGTKICGEKISVTRMDPLMAAHNSKRPRMAPNQVEHSLGHTF